MSRFLAFSLPLLLGVSPLSGQTPRIRASVGVNAVGFPQYVSADERTRTLGGAIAFRLRSAVHPVGFELALTHVPQARTDRSAAPTLTALRAGLQLVGTTVGQGAVVHGTIGPTILRIDAQEIDCGSFPICSEWAPGDLTTLGLSFGAGVEVYLTRQFAVSAQGLAHIAAAEWDAMGHNELFEMSVGIALRL